MGRGHCLGCGLQVRVFGVEQSIKNIEFHPFSLGQASRFCMSSLGQAQILGQASLG